MQSAASELELLEAAARDAGALARQLLTKPLEVHSKGDAGPVTNIDFAVDALLTERLRGARPEYGWLSEEAPDDPTKRMGKPRTFMLDPIDGTAALVGRVPQWTISVGLIEGDQAFAGAIYNPMTDEMFTGAIGHGAWLNKRQIQTSAATKLEGARMIGQRSRFSDRRWDTPWPKLDVIERQSIAYRMALVAAGQAEGTILFGWKHDWDIAAGAAIIAAAGGVVSDPWGYALEMNQLAPHVPGVVAAGAGVHPLLIERTSVLPDPRD